MRQPTGHPTKEDLMSDETNEPFVPQQQQPPSSEQLEGLWTEEEEVTDFSDLCEGLGEAMLNVDW